MPSLFRSYSHNLIDTEVSSDAAYAAHEAFIRYALLNFTKK